jgi:hypothetical protein
MEETLEGGQGPLRVVAPLEREREERKNFSKSVGTSKLY